MSAWARSDTVLWRRVEGGVLLLELDAEAPALLGGSGAALWAVLEEPATEDELVRELAELYGTTVDVVAVDVHPVLAQLEGLKLIRRIPAGP